MQKQLSSMLNEPIQDVGDLVPHKRNRKKNFSKNKKHPNFPMKGPRNKKIKIIPAHRLIFQNYKDQGFRSLGKAIRKTRLYSESLETRVNVLTKTKSWQMLMAEFMPEEVLAQRHSELLDKREYRKITSSDGMVTEVDSGPDTQAVTKALEMAYKLRGSFSKEDPKPQNTVMYNLFYKPEVREQIKAFEDGIKQSLLNEINKRNLADIKAEEEREGEVKPAGGGDGGVEEGVEPASTG